MRDFDIRVEKNNIKESLKYKNPSTSANSRGMYVIGIDMLGKQ